ncbi:MAG: acylneuraminate cytidylyltransferase family protein [Pseudomonadota bacterium]
MIAIVPARGGSKGLVGKNVLPLAGKPLIHYTLECAIASNAISRVIVTTDSEEIANAARQIKGVEVPFLRPPELASDTAQAADVYLHAADWLRHNEKTFDAEVCGLLPTAPLRAPEDVDACIDLYMERSAHVVLGVSLAKPASWQQTMDGNGQLRPIPQIANSIDNRQSFGNAVAPNGSVYVLNVDALRATRTYFGARTFGYLMPADRSIDIDGEDDLRIADALLKAKDRS